MNEDKLKEIIVSQAAEIISARNERDNMKRVWKWAEEENIMLRKKLAEIEKGAKND